MPSEFGRCHICGEEGPLTFEHVPPRNAFNRFPVVEASIMDRMNAEPRDPIRGRTNQRGAGAYTLCARCNNQTGHWYGNTFAHWCAQGIALLDAAGTELRLAYPFHTLPLKVLKQIVTMFMSVNGPGFQSAHPDLVRFVLNPRMMHLPPKYRFFAYLMREFRLRYFGLTAKVSEQTGPCYLSEIAFPPFGYVLTLASNPPDPRLCEITQFAGYPPTRFADVFLHLPVLHTIAPLPGDYRNEEQLLLARDEGLAFMRAQQTGPSS